MTALDHAHLRPIETLYKGYRFRSRLEARWAVFFDAAGIEWQYEVEGFNLDGRRYLPDFWLPRFEAFVEIKPNTEACKQTEPIILSLAMATGHRVILIAGSPNIIEPPKIIDFTKCQDWGTTIVRKRSLSWQQCLFCDRVSIGDHPDRCDCAPNIKLIHYPSAASPRVDHAMGEAQRARFEHGEDGRPRPYTVTPSTATVCVYVAGAVIEATERYYEGEPYENHTVLPWRAEIFGRDALQAGSAQAGRFIYTGPTIYLDHGQGNHELADQCWREARDADVLFGWIDRIDTIGTLVEIGAAHCYRKPIFLAFAYGLDAHFYFARQLATVAVGAPSAVAAWDLFVRWQNQRAAS
jgi:hypothetical protein